MPAARAGRGLNHLAFGADPWPRSGRPCARRACARKIDINEVEAATKIRAKYLRALENEEWDLLPGPTYVKSFLRTYGGVPRARRHAADRGVQAPATSTPPTSTSCRSARTSTRARKPPRPPRVPRGWFIAAAIVALLVLFVVHRLASAATTTTATARPHATSRRAPSSRRSARARRPRQGAGRGGGHARRPRGARCACSSCPPATVFACVVDANGKRGRHRVEPRSPAQPTQTFRSKRFRLTVGNGAVTLQVNGKSIDVPDRARRGRLRRCRRARRATSCPTAQGPHDASSGPAPGSSSPAPRSSPGSSPTATGRG